MAVGRPTEYDPERIASEFREYLADREERSQLPTIEGLALWLKVSRDTLYEWAKNHPEFSDILGELKTLQADKLIQGGLSNRFNATITKLMLSKHGYKDESDITSGGEPISPLSESDRTALTELRDILKQRAA